MKKVVAVIGASGSVGNSVCDALSRDYTVRIVCFDGENGRTPTPGGDTETKHANLNDVDSLCAALDGVWACFIATITDFCDSNAMKKEINIGKNLALACSRAKISHVIYNTQLSVVRILGLRATHMDAKAEVEDALKERGLPLTCIIIPCLFEMLLVPPFRPIRKDGGLYSLEIPAGTTNLDMIGAVDVGEVVRSVLGRPQEFLHKTLSISGDKCSMRDIVDTLNSQMSPRRFKDKQITVQEFGRQNFPGAADLANMFDFYSRVDQRASIDLTKKLYPSVCSFNRWVSENKDLVATALDYPSTPSRDPWS